MILFKTLLKHIFDLPCIFPAFMYSGKKPTFKYKVRLYFFVEINKIVLVSVYTAIALYFLYKTLFKKSPFRDEYERLYNEILNSDKYKVKDQWSDREK